jgi:hypothetical protein
MKHGTFATIAAAAIVLQTVAFAGAAPFQAETLPARVVATGIPGAGAVMQVGTFQQGSPLRDNPTWVPFTAPGAVLHHDRVLVSSTSNFGAPLARADQNPGSILSLDVSAGPLEVPADFAAAGGQASALAGRIILFTANSPAFRNGINNSGAVTADEVAASLPLGISFNNGHGRPWLANAPSDGGEGTITVLDADGRPLAGAPSSSAGGVFAGQRTNRSGDGGPGLTAGALATALITKSPDGSNRAVFLAALADGSVAQVHVEKGVDGLLPPGSFTPLPAVTRDAVESNRADDLTRVGMAFNWAPTRNVFVTDPLANRILVLDLSDDGTLFAATKRTIRSRRFNWPVDIAPAAVEIGTRNFCSNTTLGVGSDLYVLNRGDNSIVRMTREGRIIAHRRIAADVPELRASGIAASPDASTLWITGTTPGGGGVLLEAPAFGRSEVTDAILEHAAPRDEVAQGTDLFSMTMTDDQGLGPLFNGDSCESCHFSPSAGGMGTDPDSFVTRLGHSRHGELRDLGVARQFSVHPRCESKLGVPPNANVTSLRSAMTLRGVSLLDFIREIDVGAVRAAQPTSVRGRKNILEDGRMGRFGWKAQRATLVEFLGDALRDELGVTNAVTEGDLVKRCGARRAEADSVVPTALVAFLNQIDPPEPAEECLASPGGAVFDAIGCAACHTPTFAGPGARTIRPYTDLLLHDMGASLADGFAQGSATSSEFRTPPLWRVADRSHFLHDGRARTLSEAIIAHGGQGEAAAESFSSLDARDRQALLDFLGCV